MKFRNLALCALATVMAVTVMTTPEARAEKLRIASGIGILFAPIHIMKEARLLEAAAKEKGLDLQLEVLSFPSGSAVTDALLSRNVDIVTAGVSNALLLWSRTKEDVKALGAVSGTKSVLVTKDSAIQSLADFKPTNRISVTSLKISNQAIYLQMALDKQFGDYAKFDPMMVQLGFTDAVQAMMNPRGPIDTMFAGPPYYQQLLKQPGMRSVLTTLDVAGPTTNLLAFTTSTFHKTHPQEVAAFLTALDQAQQMINTRPLEAAKLYLKSTGEKFPPEEIAAMFGEEGNIYQLLPRGVDQMAAFMAKAGMIHRAPKNWKEFFFADLQNAPGAESAN